MKKTLLTLIAGAALTAGGAAFAQGAECNAGSAWGPKPGCGLPHNAQPIPGVTPNTPQAYYGWGAWGFPYAWNNQGQAYANQGYPYDHQAQVAPNVVPQWGAANATPGDRDGDGVRNRADRYPDDARYR